jgi:hypothetical protein
MFVHVKAVQKWAAFFYLLKFVKIFAGIKFMLIFVPTKQTNKNYGHNKLYI